MKRIVPAVAALLLAACAQKNIENKDAIRQAVVEYVAARQAQTGLDVSTMDVNVLAMTFERDTARASVEFRVKGGDAGMQINYTLDRKGDKWVVQPNGGGHGVPAAEPGGVAVPGDGKAGGALPPGHPAVPASPQSSPKQ